MRANYLYTKHYTNFYIYAKFFLRIYKMLLYIRQIFSSNIYKMSSNVTQTMTVKDAEILFSSKDFKPRRGRTNKQPHEDC